MKTGLAHENIPARLNAQLSRYCLFGMNSQEITLFSTESRDKYSYAIHVHQREVANEVSCLATPRGSIIGLPGLVIPNELPPFIRSGKVKNVRQFPN